ncbi:hypothetical protein MMC09_005063 [Bachmanniomyces sp. S44760]|nr:hypothetical protein [Bachmanniomyces sp. S44760]
MARNILNEYIQDIEHGVQSTALLDSLEGLWKSERHRRAVPYSLIRRPGVYDASYPLTALVFGRLGDMFPCFPYPERVSSTLSTFFIQNCKAIMTQAPDTIVEYLSTLDRIHLNLGLDLSNVISCISKYPEAAIYAGELIQAQGSNSQGHRISMELVDAIQNYHFQSSARKANKLATTGHSFNKFLHGRSRSALSGQYLTGQDIDEGTLLDIYDSEPDRIVIRNTIDRRFSRNRHHLGYSNVPRIVNPAYFNDADSSMSSGRSHHPMVRPMMLPRSHTAYP